MLFYIYNNMEFFYDHVNLTSVVAKFYFIYEFAGSLNTKTMLQVMSLQGPTIISFSN